MDGSSRNVASMETSLPNIARSSSTYKGEGKSALVAYRFGIVGLGREVRPGQEEEKKQAAGVE
jgi:phage tail tube protein FII